MSQASAPRYFRVFFGSSVEGLPYARAIAAQLEYDADVRIWTDEFLPSTNTLYQLIKSIQESDYGIFLLTPDDQLTLRGEQTRAARDNVLFELGLCYGILGYERTVAIRPRNVGPLRIPTDLYGVSLLDYDPAKGTIDSAVGTAGHKIRMHMQLHRHRDPALPDLPLLRPAPVEEPAQPEELPT